MSDHKAVFVTGASGFVGGALASSLIEDGYPVRALARSESSAEKVRALGAQPVMGDLDDVGAITAGAEGCDLAFHAAALPAEWGTREEFEAANIVGTRNTLDGCRAAGVECFVHVGTEAACFDMQPLHDIDETAPLRPDSSVLYASTKAAAEQLVQAANGPGFETVTLRPRLVWGPGDTGILPGFVEAVESGRFTWAGNGSHMTSTTHIDNCVHGLRLVAEKGRPGEAYFVSDGDPLPFRDFITGLLATEGVTPPDKNIPAGVVRIGSVAAESVWKLLRLKSDPPLTRMAYFLIANEVTVDITKAREELGYEPQISVEDGLAALAG